MRYTSLAQLRRAATVVATFRPTGATSVRRIAGIPFTLAQFTVTKTLAGSPLAGKPIVRELGAPGVIVDGGHALFEREDTSRRPAVCRRLDRSRENALPAQITAARAARRA